MVMEDKRYWYDATVVKVIDGDTVDVRIDPGLDLEVRMRCRLYGINTPELRGVTKAAGMRAREQLKQWLKEAADKNGRVVCRTVKDRRDKYGRYLIEFFLRDGRSINQELVAGGFAVDYMLD